MIGTELNFQPAQNTHSSSSQSMKFDLPWITQDRKLLDLIEMARGVAQSRAPVLLQGDRGTGRREMAMWIHAKSTRRNMSVLFLDLFRMKDCFQQAKEGTLIALEIQRMTLVEQNQFMECLAEFPNVRLVCTAQGSLEEKVKIGEFKEDLFKKISVVHFRLPKLSERLGDIEFVSNILIKRLCQKNERDEMILSKDALDMLNQHNWSGNLKELESTLERAVLVCDQTEIQGSHIQFQQKKQTQGRSSGVVWQPGKTLSEIERNVILEALKHYSGNRTHTAKALGISIRTLRNKLAEFRVMGIFA